MVGQLKFGDKIYVVVRGDLSPGAQAVQGMHAFRQFVADYPDIESEWFEVSNHIAFLSVADEKELLLLREKLLECGKRVSCFYEPDMSFSLTSIVSDWQSSKLLSRLRLALN